jgi:hypothetical protein
MLALPQINNSWVYKITLEAEKICSGEELKPDCVDGDNFGADTSLT